MPELGLLVLLTTESAESTERLSWLSLSGTAVFVCKAAGWRKGPSRSIARRAIRIRSIVLRFESVSGQVLQKSLIASSFRKESEGCAKIRPEPDSNRRMMVLQTIALANLAIGPQSVVML